MNSTAKQEVNINITEILGILVLPTQHSITRSRVSFAHVTSSGSNSKPSRRDSKEKRECKSEFNKISCNVPPAADGRDTSKKRGGGEGGNEISDGDDPYLESFLPPSPWAKTARHRSCHCVPLCRTWLKSSNGCDMCVAGRRGSQKRGGQLL